jgi:hypothetical protein
LKKAHPTEADYMRALLLRAPLAFPDVRLFRRNVSAGKVEGGGYMRVGEPGQCDLYALRRGSPKAEAWHFEIELKRFTKLSPAQERWRDWCEDWGVPWTCLQVHKGELPGETIERWLRELRKFLAAR